MGLCNEVKDTLLKGSEPIKKICGAKTKKEISLESTEWIAKNIFIQPCYLEECQKANWS